MQTHTHMSVYIDMEMYISCFQICMSTLWDLLPYHKCYHFLSGGERYILYQENTISEDTDSFTLQRKDNFDIFLIIKWKVFLYFTRIPDIKIKKPYISGLRFLTYKFVPNWCRNSANDFTLWLTLLGKWRISVCSFMLHTTYFLHLHIAVKSMVFTIHCNRTMTMLMQGDIHSLV